MQGYTLTNVLDSAEPQNIANKQYVDRANKASVFSDGRYLAVGNVSMGSRRIYIVGMPVEKHQASNKFYVDAIVESTTAGDKALVKIQDRGFATAG